MLWEDFLSGITKSLGMLTGKYLVDRIEHKRLKKKIEKAVHEAFDHQSDKLLSLCMEVEFSDKIFSLAEGRSIDAQKLVQEAMEHQNMSEADILNELKMFALKLTQIWEEICPKAGDEIIAFRNFLRSMEFMINQGAGSLISYHVADHDLHKLVIELSEWKTIHNDSQTLINSLNFSLNLMDKYRYEQISTRLIEDAGLKWQKLCVSKLKNLPRKWNFQRAHTPEMDALFEIITPAEQIDGITRQLMQPDIEHTEIIILMIQLEEINGILWDLLTAADKRVMILINTMYPALMGNSNGS